MKSQGLRHWLRAETRAEHERTEAAFSGFDMTTREGYVGFLNAHANALNALIPQLASYNPVGLNPKSLVQLISDDLKDLNADYCFHMIRIPEKLAPLGIAYVVSGSHLGAKVLQKSVVEISSASQPKFVRYLNSLHLQQVWKKVLLDLSNEHSDAEKHAILSGASGAFGIFLEAAEFGLAKA